jgi:hypothetical protein
LHGGWLGLTGLAGLAGGQNLRGGLGYLGLKLVELLLDNLFVVGKVGFQPFEGTGIVLGLEIALEFIQLLVAHLVSQADADAHFQSFINMLKQAVFLGVGQAGQTDFLQ